MNTLLLPLILNLAFLIFGYLAGQSIARKRAAKREQFMKEAAFLEGFKRSEDLNA